jgi:hypothetical protein
MPERRAWLDGPMAFVGGVTGRADRSFDVSAR